METTDTLTTADGEKLVELGFRMTWEGYHIDAALIGILTDMAVKKGWTVVFLAERLPADNLPDGCVSFYSATPRQRFDALIEVLTND